jgi:hypothetical protein
MDLRRKDNENAISAILVRIWRPGKSGPLERLTN